MAVFDVLYWLVVTIMVCVAAVMLYAFLLRYPRPEHGDPEEIVDPWPEKSKEKPYSLRYTKQVRLRYWFTTVVLGHYRWLWSAKLHARLFDLVLGAGDINIYKRREK
jgi:hypothetical protein